MKTNVLYFGDNLEILRNREYFPDECVDLIYLDPPFNSKKDYNILFKENGGVDSEAQIKAFTDTWHWTQTAADTYHDIVGNGPLKVGKLIGALHDAIGGNDVMAYLVMMTARLVELHRVLKPTGSLYLHCDPTASHYLKLVLDQIFRPANFQNEIVWFYRRWTAESQRFQRMHDVLLFYCKNRSKVTFSRMKLPVREYLQQRKAKGWNTNTIQTREGRIRQLLVYDREQFDKAVKRGRLNPSDYDRVVYAEQRELAAPDVWEIPFINPAAKERLGYPTQKPLALLERIIKTSSNDGDIVLDPFCGCGTALVAAHKLNRRWIGIDITHLATNLTQNRLNDSFGVEAEVIGE